jgi:hypothetical protein
MLQLTVMNSDTATFPPKYLDDRDGRLLRNFLNKSLKMDSRKITGTAQAHAGKAPDVAKLLQPKLEGSLTDDHLYNPRAPLRWSTSRIITATPSFLPRVCCLVLIPSMGVTIIEI